MKLQVRTLSPWPLRIELEDTVFSDEIPEEKADALLANWGPLPELFTFPRRKAWYSVEPPCQFDYLGGGSWPKIRDRLAPHEFLWYNHPDERFRIPEATHFEPLSVALTGRRKAQAVAVVSNFGGRPWQRLPDMQFRNRIITLPEVDLFGREGWRRYRHHWYSLPKTPSNYQGPIAGDWPATEKRELLAKYSVVICLENMREPHSFSEKFVEAACAGAVPIYQAHPTVRDHFLSGARWIDPGDYGDDPEATLSAALAADREEFSEANRQWIETSPELAETHLNRIFAKIARALRDES